jgi:ubiquinone/menaquinone biosynthesis C-methylase UbiE
VSDGGWAERVLEAAALQPGDTVLDLGGELGLLTFGAHERIGDGWVIAVDPSPAMLEELLTLAHQAGASGIMYLVGDAEVLPLPDASVDVAVAASLRVDGTIARELARVLRPGGRLSLTATDADEVSRQLRRAGFVLVEECSLHVAARREGG